jgi:hypothetical protein
MGAYGRIRGYGGQVRLVRPRAAVLDLLRRLRLTEVLEVQP